MLTFKENISTLGLLLLFIGINCYLFTQEIFWLSVLPGILFLLWLAFKYPYKTALFIAFATPLSIKYTFKEYNLSINLPSEPMLIIMLAVFWVSMLLPRGHKYDDKIFRHPISIVILFNLLWILITACTSSMPIVSLKFFVSRFWFVTVFYLMGVQMFAHYRNIKTFIWAFSFSLLIAVFYTLKRHAAEGFNQGFANYAPIPLFSDHGVYAAVLTLFIPIIGFFFYRSRALEINRMMKPVAVFLFIMFCIGVIFSYTRAAWVGMGGAIGAFVIFMLRIRFRTIAITAAVVLFGLLIFWPAVQMQLQDNKDVSASNFEQHVKSIYNISTDASNTERINRWRSAWRMFMERPLLGWGPGAYMFQYAPFQRSYEMTVISTNTGELGNAHSEYIGPLAESGVLGMLSFVAIVIISLYYGMKIIYDHPDQKIRILTMGILLGLITYYIHGFLNNYLDSDKAAVPFWAFLAILTAIDMYYKQDEAAEIQQGEQHTGSGKVIQ